MDSVLLMQAAKVTLGQSAQEGAMTIMPIVANRIVTSANMKVGTYTIANQPKAPAILSVTISTGGGVADTMGTLDFVGTDIDGNAISETVTPIAASTVYTTNAYKTVTSITGAGWVIDASPATADTIVVGVRDVVAPAGFYFSAIQVLAAAVVASQTAYSTFRVQDFTQFTSLPVGVYPTKLTKIALTSGEAVAYLTRY